MADTTAASVTIIVDDVEYRVPAGMLLIDAITDYVGYDMPRFCHHSRLDPVGMCRMCMAEVEARGRWANVATCTLRVADGMQVKVMSEAAVQARKMTLELLLINHPLDCPICDKGGECMLQDQTVTDGPEVARTIEPRRKYPKPIPISQTVLLDRERCVHCARCTRFVDEIAGEQTIMLINRGYHTEISPAFDGEYDSHFAGNTCDICPVGALTSATFRFRSRPWEMQPRPAISPFDAGGSNLRLDVRENVIRRIMPRENRAVNDCWLSDKERFPHAVIQHEARLDVALIRNPETGELEQASFADALTAAIDGLTKAVIAGGAVAGIGSTVLPLEEQYTFQKFVRGVLGSSHIACSKPLDYELRAGLTPTYERLEQAGTFFFGGANPLAEMPLAWLRIYKAIRKRGARLLTLNNRDYHLGLASSLNVPCERGREALAVRALLAVIVDERLHDPRALAANCAGWDEVADSLAGDVEALCAAAGAEPEQLRELARQLAAAEDLVVVSPQLEGRPDGAAVRDALWNLTLLCGVPGQVNGGWLEHLPNCNTRGASDMGLRPDYLPGYLPAGDKDGRAHYRQPWGLSLPTKRGLDLEGILAAADGGELAALVIVGSDLVGDDGNPFQEARNQWLNQSHNGEIRVTFEATAARRRAALERVPFVVVTDIFASATTKLADVVLPACCFAEKPGTWVNFEGRAQYAPAAVRPILGARSDLEIINALAAGVAERLEKPPAWRSLGYAEVLDEIKALVPGYGELVADPASEGVLVGLKSEAYTFVGL